MSYRQVRIFVPSDDPMANWYQTTVGKVIRPAVSGEFQGDLEWFWFSHYIDAADAGGDCDINEIGEAFKQPLPPGGGPPQHRSVRFRYSVADARREAFEENLDALITDNGYDYSDYLIYNPAEDMGSDRF